MEKHITALGVIYIAFGILGIVTGIIVFWVIAGAGMISGDEEAIFITGTVGLIIGLFFIVTSAIEIIGGIGLLKRWGWSRILVLVLGVISLIEIPIGTAIGIYTLWVLLQQEAVDYFKRIPV
ncbi:MAG: hypothetical protein GF307_02700 [candidate division Zixibacteria bacterium]|nr:hypothetical protein [candidate division Zixibacteria bacterium]